MSYTKIQPQSLLGYLEVLSVFFLPYMGMAAILFNGAEPFVHFDRPNVKSGENRSSCFREAVERLQDFIYIYSPGARAHNPRDKILIVTEWVCYFNYTL